MTSRLMRRVVQTTVPALLAVLVASAPAQWKQPLEAQVRMHLGRPMPFLNGTPTLPILYALTDVVGGRFSWEELPQHNIRRFADQGVRLFQVDLWLEHCWTAPGKFDITLARKQVKGILDVNPSAAVILRFHVTAPRWWLKSHAEEWVMYADVGYMDEHTDHGYPRILEEDNYPVRRVSMASTRWKAEGLAMLKKFLRALAKTPEGNAMAGIQVADGIYGEWHNWGFFRNEPDVSEPMQQFFRSWLTDRYRNDSTLRRAWGKEDASLSTASVPDLEERRTPAGILRDPQKEQKIIDYYTCVHQLVADNILSYARVVKETWPRPILAGTFYGYYFSVFGRAAAGGHLELHRVLTSPYIDYLSGPQAYEPEALKAGEAYRSRSLIASIRLNGKLWLDEMDVEANVPIPTDGRYAVNLRNSIGTVRRNMLFSYTKGMGLWFYDFGVGGSDLDGIHYAGRGTRGTWDHPDVLRDIGAVKRLLESRATRGYRSDADVLFVFDTESYYHCASLRGSDPVTPLTVDFATLAAFKSGIVFDPIHIRDLPSVDLSQYRVVVFGNTFLMSQRQRAFVRDHVAREGRTIVWFYAPGYSDGTRLDATAVSDLTGIRLSQTTVSGPPEVYYSLDTTGSYSVGNRPIAPLFAVTDSAAVPGGRFAGTGEIAIARKTFASHTAWYVSLPSRTTEPLRSILIRSGAHSYSSQGDIVYSGGGILAVHTKDGGKHTVTLRGGTVIALDLPEGSHTLILDPETGKELLPTPEFRP